MEWISDLRGKTVGLDTAPLIYFISAALSAGATYFFINDIKLPAIPSIKMLSLDSLR